MRVFDIKCPACGWQSPRPVSESVAKAMQALRYCRVCLEGGRHVEYEITERIVVGSVRYLPDRKGE